MNRRITDDPRTLARECETWDWVRAAGVSRNELRETLVAGPAGTPRRRNGERFPLKAKIRRPDVD